MKKKIKKIESVRNFFRHKIEKVLKKLKHDNRYEDISLMYVYRSVDEETVNVSKKLSIFTNSNDAIDKYKEILKSTEKFSFHNVSVDNRFYTSIPLTNKTILKKERRKIKFYLFIVSKESVTKIKNILKLKYLVNYFMLEKKNAIDKEHFSELKTEVKTLKENHKLHLNLINLLQEKFFRTTNFNDVIKLISNCEKAIYIILKKFSGMTQKDFIYIVEKENGLNNIENNIYIYSDKKSDIDEYRKLVHSVILNLKKNNKFRSRVFNVFFYRELNQNDNNSYFLHKFRIINSKNIETIDLNFYEFDVQANNVFKYKIGFFEKLETDDKEFLLKDQIYFRSIIEDVIFVFFLIANGRLQIINENLLKKSEKRLNDLVEIGKIINSIKDINDLLKKIIDIISSSLNASIITIFLYNETTNSLEYKFSKGVSEFNIKNISIDLKDNDFYITDSFINNKIYLLKDIHNTELSKEFVFQNCNMNSSIYVPLIYKEENNNKHKIGVLHIANKRKNEFFSDDDLEILSAIANSASIAIKTHDYFKKVLESENLTKQLSLASIIQKKLFPANMPEIKNLDIQGISMPAKSIGGDYFDFYTLSETKNKLGIIIADVSGKGIPAALLMSTARSILKSIAFNYQSTSSILEKTNELIMDDIDIYNFITMFYVIIEETDKDVSKLKYSNAAHNPMLFYSTKDDEFYEYISKGIPIGVFPKQTYNEEEIEFSQGDILFLYTDGVTEAKAADGSMYGLDRVKEIIRDMKDESSNRIIERVKHDIELFSNGASQHDDTTMIIVKKD